MARSTASHQVQARRLGLRVQPAGASLLVYRQGRVLGSIDSRTEDITEALRALEAERGKALNLRFQAALDRIRSRTFEEWRVARGGRPRAGRIRRLVASIF